MKIAQIIFSAPFPDDMSDADICQAMEETIRQDRNWPSDEQITILSVEGEDEELSLAYQGGLAELSGQRLAAHLDLMGAESLTLPVQHDGESFEVKVTAVPGYPPTLEDLAQAPTFLESLTECMYSTLPFAEAMVTGDREIVALLKGVALGFGAAWNGIHGESEEADAAINEIPKLVAAVMASRKH